MQLLGKSVAKKIEDQDILAVTKKEHCHLAIVLIGENPNSRIYVREKVKAGRKLGVEISVYKFSEIDDLLKIQETIRYLNEDKDVVGIIIQLPLPETFASETNQLISLIYQSKDVDSLTDENKKFNQKITVAKSDQFGQKFRKLKKLYAGKKILMPPTATGIMEILDFYQINLQEALLVGRGLLVGQPVAKLLNQIEIPFQVIHSQTSETKKKQLLKKAKVIISGTSSPLPVFSHQDLDKEAVIIDCAGDFDHNDIDRDRSRPVRTPLIGGVGPVTVACLLRNVVLAKSWQK